MARLFSHAILPHTRTHAVYCIRRSRGSCVQVRILLACLFLPRRELESLHEPLQSLADVARNDDDEWVKVTALALGDCQGV